MQRTIPVTILTGFLGSGKTTLLNHILRNKDGYKIAVIENEFGAEGIDGSLIETTKENIIEIQNGCVCCSVRGDLIDGVKKLLESGKEFDYLIIEASGVSEPLPIAQTFLIEDFGGKVRLDSTVCLVDAQNFRHNLVQSLVTTFEQIEFANFIILNKVSEVSQKEIEEIKKSIKELNKYCTIIEVDYGKVDLAYILDTTGYDMNEDIEKKLLAKNLKKEKQKFQDQSEVHHGHHDHTHEHNHEHDDEHEHHHHHSIEVEEYLFKTEEKCYHLENMKNFLGELPEDIFRVKGFMHFKDYPDKRYLIQKAGSCFTLGEDEKWDKKDEVSRIVFIGKNIDKNALQDKLLHNVFFNL